jgi:hypothetical protein
VKEFLDQVNMDDVLKAGTIGIKWFQLSVDLCNVRFVAEHHHVSPAYLSLRLQLCETAFLIASNTARREHGSRYQLKVSDAISILEYLVSIAHHHYCLYCSLILL